MNLTELCTRIDEGYAAGKSGLDDGMLDLLIELGNCTAEIKALCAPCPACGKDDMQVKDTRTDEQVFRSVHEREAPQLRYTIDGTDTDNFTRDGGIDRPPYYVYDSTTETWPAGPFGYRKDAHDWIAAKLRMELLPEVRVVDESEDITTWSDEKLSKELFAASAPGKDADAVRWHHRLLNEKARRVMSAAPNGTAEKPTIPHADLIRAVLDGKVVQLKFDTDPERKWHDYTGRTAIGWLCHPMEMIEARLKPEPLVSWYGLDSSGLLLDEGFRLREDCVAYHEANDNIVTKFLRLELDPDTLDMISARTEAP